MSDKEGPRLQGKFIKVNDPILDYVKVSPFNLDEISTFKKAHTDNPDRSIIHLKLHEPEDVEIAVKEPGMYTVDFDTEHTRRPLLIPFDFTRDWERMRSRSSRKNPRFEDEDEIEMELEYLKAQEGSKSNTENSETKDPKAKSETETSDTQDVKALDSSDQGPPEILEEPEDSSHQDSDPSGDILQQEMDALGEMSKQIPKSPDQMSSASLNIKDAQPPSLDEDIPEDHSSHDPQIQTDQFGQEQLEQPTANLDTPEENSIPAPEPDSQLNESLENALKEKSRQIEMLSQISHDVEGLKKEILKSATDNFKTICETLLESLLKKEYKLHPQSFAQVIERAVSEAVEGDSYHILVHPNSLQNMQDILGAELSQRLEAQDDIAEGDFKVRTDFGEIDGSAHKIITDLLDSAGIELYTEEEVS